MKKLSAPAFSDIETYLTCTSSVANEVFRNRLESCSNIIQVKTTEYVQKAVTAELYSISYFSTVRGVDPVVVGNLKKSELTKMYSTYMVNKQYPARYVYDAILVAANDKCPFCGGIGQPKTLDHYLPKANYPFFSVLPANLVPSCRDCNAGKSNNLALQPGKQVLHPYFDNDCYFNERWISAKVVMTNPIALEFYVNPPINWNQLRIERVTSHFTDFDLAKRYSLQAAEELSTLIYQRNSFMENFTSSEFRDYLMSLDGDILFINHWKRVMYAALAANVEFCG